MRVRNLLVSSAVTVGLVVVMAASAATAASSTSITALTVSPSATAIAVAGKALFANGAGPAGVDGSDGAQHGKVPGSDIKGGTIALSDNNRELVFTLEIANMADQRLPNVFYTWPLTVDETDAKLFLLAGPAGLAASSTPTTEPFFDLKSVGSGGFSQVASLTGSIGNGKVTWNVPLSAIGAKFGSTITAGTTAGNKPGVGTGVPGALHTYANLDVMERVEEYVVPGAVSVGLAPATVADEQVATSTPATIKTAGSSTGSFTASLPRPAEAGEYKVVTKACSTEGDCVIKSVLLTL